MTQLTDHAKTILRAIADEKPIEVCIVHGEWGTAEYDWVLRELQNKCVQFRIKPETRSINGVEFAAPDKVRGADKWNFSLLQIDQLTAFKWVEEKDRDTAHQAIVDALEGKTK